MFSKSVKSVCMIAAFGVLMAGAAWAAEPEATAPAAKPAAKAAKPAKPADDVAVFDTSKGRMVAEFWEKDAPQTVANFKKLARQGFYNGTGFHRIMKGFMIQGGDPNSKNPNAPDLGTGGPGYNINDEFNSHLHVKGVLSMAHTSAPNSGGSQFFIMHATQPHLDGKYTAFGRVIEGMDVLDAIANSPTGPNAMMGGEKSRPLEWTTIKTVKVVPRASLAKGAAKSTTKSAAASGKAAGQAKAEAAKAAAPEPKEAAAAATPVSTPPPAVEPVKEAAQPPPSAADSTKAAADTTHSH